MRFLPILFSLTLFCSAVLSFSIQPILGKMLLPLVGGAPAGWIVAMAFFQLSLLAGYGVSWFLERFSPWVHGAVLVGLYLAGLFFLPPHLPQLTEYPVGIALSALVVRVLFQAVFMPFVALTATTAALQRVFSQTKHPTAHDPYYLFVASNLGSFIGLFLYPFVLEPFSGLKQQAHLWQDVYFIVIALIVLSIVSAWRVRNEIVQRVSVVKTKVATKDVFWWLVLAFVPCSLSMGVTTVITTDVAGIPLFWTIPLGLYLLTFVLAFSNRNVISIARQPLYHLFAVMLLVMSMGVGLKYQPAGDLITFFFVIAILLTVFFVIALICHSTLARLRPASDRLAFYYFIIALGGGLAGIMHAFLLPFLLKGVIEFPVMVVLSLLLHPEFRHPDRSPRMRQLRYVFWICLIITLGGVCVTALLDALHIYPRISFVASFMFKLAMIFVALQPRMLFAAGVLVLCLSSFNHFPGHVQKHGRNFFGAWAVYDVFNGERKFRYFAHGNTIHGLTVFNTKTHEIKYGSTYYSYNNPIHDALIAANAKTFGIIGLGTGQLACYSKKLTIDFYEIDPDVEGVARAYFPYLDTCPPRDIVIGDGRVMIGQSASKYDTLLLDAFTSDGIPLHLLTREAVQLYRLHMNPNGVILFHISNRFFDLAAPLAAIAKAEKLPAYEKYFFAPKDQKDVIFDSHWVAMPLSDKATKSLQKSGWQLARAGEDVWTDDRSTLLTAVKMPPLK